MGDFRIKVQADLDAKDLTAKLSKLNKEKIKIPVDVKGLEKVDNLEKSLNKLRSLENIKINVDASSLKGTSSEIKNLATIIKGLSKESLDFNISGINKQMAEAGNKAGKSFTTALQKQVEVISKTQRNAFSEPLNNLSKQQKSYSDWWEKELGKSSNKNYGKNSQIQAIDEYLSEMKAQEKRIQEIKRRFSQGFVDVDITGIKKTLDRYNGTDSSFYKDAEQSYKRLLSLKKEIETGVSDDSFKKTLSDSDIEKRWNEYGSVFEKCNNQIKAFKNESSGITKPFNQLDAVTASNRTLTWLKNNNKAAKEYGETLTQLAEKQRTASSTEELRGYTKQVKAITSAAQANGLTGSSKLTDMKRAFGQIFEFAGMYGAIQNIAFEVPRQMISAVRDVNASQIELTKVSDASSGQLSQYWDQAADSAKKYGATISDVINNTADWSRLGYSLDESKKLSDATTLLQKVGDNMTQQSSSEGMISVLKGFQKDADEAESIVDKVNQVANTQPIDTSGLFEGLSRSASSMDAANNSLEQTIALITAANSVVQDPASIGTAFKTISMRIRGATTEMEEAGLDTDGMAESTAKLRKEIKALSGVDIMKNKDEFKSTYDILDELSNKWSDLTDIQQASVTELIAGKRQGNIVSALMKNFDIARDTLNTAMNESEGSAEKELGNYQKGIEYSIDKFKATFQELSTNALDSNIFKAVVDSGTAVVDVLNKIISVGKGIPALFATFAGVKLFKNLDLFYLNWSLHTQEYNENGVVNKCVLLTF